MGCSRSKKLRRLIFPALPTALFLLALAIAGTATACPSCKEALAAGDPERAHLVQGFFWSILFMLAMPFSLLTAFCAYAYFLVRRANREKEAKLSAAA